MLNKNYTVVVADDDKTTRLVLTRILEKEGYRVLDADRPEKCLFLALEKPVDAFLLDLNMPGMSGIEICRRLRSMEAHKITPIIFITSQDEDTKLQEAFDVGATDFMVKPAHQIVLTARLRSHLKTVEYFNELQQVKDYANRYISTRTRRVIEAYSITGLIPVPELHNVCIMFTDVRGFTSLTHEVPLETLFDCLSKHLGMQVDMVHKHGGYIDKFGGDGLMVIFDCDDMAKKACLCALEIIESTLNNLNVLGARQLPVGIGIHYGEVMIGNIGSTDQLDYSAIGETVNVAARLCGSALPMKVNVSEQLIKILSDAQEFEFSTPYMITMKGLSNPVPVYNLLKYELRHESSGATS
jgi:class 3 adenylate cyclase